MEWKNEIQAVAFQPEGHGASCMIHRLAIRTLTGASPGPEDCLVYARANEALLRAAAAHKIEMKAIARGHSLHLSSRDVRRLPISK